MYVRAIDQALDWGNGLRRQRDLLRDMLSTLLVEIDPESDLFADAADLFVLTDPDSDEAEEIAAHHAAMVAAQAPHHARSSPTPQPLSEAIP